MKNDSVKLIECFKNTFQGEGPDSGQRFSLLRFKYCNRNCSFCDTKLKMRLYQEGEYKIEELQKMLNEEKTNLMITGGEPTFEKHFDDCVTLLNDLKYKLANVETNGYNLEKLVRLINPSKNIHYIFSPKIENQKDLDRAIELTEYFILNYNVYTKIVYQNTDLINKYLDFVSERNDYNRIWLMPEGATREELIKNSPEVFDACEKYKLNFSSRNHIIYGFI